MLKKIAHMLDRLSKGKTLVLLFAAGLALIFLFQVRNHHLEQLSGKSRPTLDGKLYYSPDSAFAIIDSLGEKGRNFYALTELTLDLIFPIIYSLLLSLLIIYLFKRPRKYKHYQLLGFIPFVGFFADILENASIVGMAYSYPDKNTLVAGAASTFTCIKWISLMTSAVIIVIGLARILLMRKTPASGQERG